ncbi:MAG TPA: hypothetical protein VN224_16925, partial [Xanthomonadales bacterium]|nr:hypothetical protein [Xanthomonadales bacterium]
FYLGALPLIVLAGFAAPRAPRRAVAIAAPFAYLACAALRNVPLAAIACAPLAATALSALLPSLAAFRPIRSRAVAIAAIAVSFLTVVTASALAARGTSDDRPLLAIEQLAALPVRHRLLCENFAWCGPAVETERVSVFVDGRADPFPAAVWSDYDAIVHARPAWRALVRRYGVDALLAHRGGSLDRAARDDGWHVARDEPISLLLHAPR